MILNKYRYPVFIILAPVINYASAKNVITDRNLNVHGPSIRVYVPERSGVWIRAVKIN
jgi:hypothetical protein